MTNYIEQDGRKLHLLNDKLAVTSDGTMNILLMERYEKQDGRGKNAQKTGELGWRNLNGGAYFGNLDSLGTSLLRQDVIEAVGEVGLDLEPFKSFINEKLEEYKSFLKEQITLELSKTKDTSKVEDVPVTTKNVKIKKK